MCPCSSEERERASVPLLLPPTFPALFSVVGSHVLPTSLGLTQPSPTEKEEEDGEGLSPLSLLSAVLACSSCCAARPEAVQRPWEGCAHARTAQVYCGGGEIASRPNAKSSAILYELRTLRYLLQSIYTPCSFLGCSTPKSPHSRALCLTLPGKAAAAVRRKQQSLAAAAAASLMDLFSPPSERRRRRQWHRRR